MMTTRRLVSCAALFLCVSTSSATADVGDTLFVRLDPRFSDYFEERCLGPCACPHQGFHAPLSGGMTMVLEVDHPPAYSRYRITGVHWQSMIQGNEVSFVGDGTYELFGDFVLQERLTLNLIVNDAASQEFDSDIIFNQPLTASAPQVVCTRRHVTPRWVPRCAADWNGIGGADSQDFFDFLEDFFAGHGDFNGADGADSQDYFDFVDALLTGC